jgi:glutathione peroxidase
MKHKFIIAVFTILFLSSSLTGLNCGNGTTGDDLADDINNIKITDMNGEIVNLSDYNGSVLLIVNVASECGNTPQYSSLEEIYKIYKPEGFEILAFPCNDFGGQEPGTNEEIMAFCSTNYNVTFKLFDKVKILGEDKSELYERLTNNSVTETSDIKPTAEQVTKLIEKELAKG